MNKPMTIAQLFRFCQKQIKLGHGDYTIMLSDDDEGNGYHYCWYSFTPVDEYTQEFIDKSIASADKTIILG